MQQRFFRVTMSMRELDRLKCIQAVIDGELPAVSRVIQDARCASIKMTRDHAAH
jgi:hypothetical protein